MWNRLFACTCTSGGGSISVYWQSLATHLRNELAVLTIVLYCIDRHSHVVHTRDVSASDVHIAREGHIGQEGADCAWVWNVEYCSNVVAVDC